MHRRSSKLWLIPCAALVVIAAVVAVLLSGNEGLRGKIVKLEGNTVTLQAQGGLSKTVKLDNTEGLAVGMEVEIEHYNAHTMTGDKAHVVSQ